MFQKFIFVDQLVKMQNLYRTIPSTLPLRGWSGVFPPLKRWICHLIQSFCTIVNQYIYIYIYFMVFECTIWHAGSYKGGNKYQSRSYKTGTCHQPFGSRWWERRSLGWRRFPKGIQWIYTWSLSDKKTKMTWWQRLISFKSGLALGVP